VPDITGSTVSLFIMQQLGKVNMFVLELKSMSLAILGQLVHHGIEPLVGHIFFLMCTA